MSEIITRKVGPNAAKKALLAAFKVKRPVFMWGPPGVGKSDIVSQLGQELNAHVIDIRLSLWEPTDIKGIPYFNPEKHTMQWAHLLSCHLKKWQNNTKPSFYSWMK